MHHFPLRSQKFFWGEGHLLPTPHPLIACKLKQGKLLFNCSAMVCYKPSVVGVGSGFRLAARLLDPSGQDVTSWSMCVVRRNKLAQAIYHVVRIYRQCSWLMRIVSFRHLHSGLATMQTTTQEHQAVDSCGTFHGTYFMLHLDCTVISRVKCSLLYCM